MQGTDGADGQDGAPGSQVPRSTADFAADGISIGYNPFNFIVPSGVLWTRILNAIITIRINL